MDKIVFARIAWHPRYDGKYPLPYTAAYWTEKPDAEFAEWLNFKAVRGKCYGWVKPSSSWTADLKNLEAGSETESIEGVTVIWVARDPNGGSKIVGWYENATMFSNLKDRPKPLKFSYLFVAHSKDCVLLEESQRTFRIEKNFRNLWYAKDETSFKEKVIEFLAEGGSDLFIDPVETDFSDIEGKRKLVNHLRVERSSKLVRKFKESLQDFKCTVCDFDFEKQYGDIGRHFIEAHHIKPVSSYKSDGITSIKDLAAVCSNCHRMLHRNVPQPSVNDLIQTIKKRKK
ncbi:MAG: HNH endonuclease [Proteobacteria bacterium]|nr:hypothetical protein [Desulfocapsa sp.]MBU3945018.1 HNH endonuclease [Pseudomonadota bacterium]MCG2742415.1 HNH endonuclease [Desulfobacteraceae bacterium]MBU4030501.1 HNH endonuclease [Pseudomonadota bacterium]MBU4042271.1 HNH endonuclease [Pseudomonadota bacterium]